MEYPKRETLEAELYEGLKARLLEYHEGLFNKDKKLVYHGRVDDNWKDEDAVTREELKIAVEIYLQGKPIPSEQYPSMGCSIKWRAGHCA